eukprot:768432-Hanusia_phi.AAC.10
MRAAWRAVVMCMAVGLAMVGGSGSRSDKTAPMSGFEAAGQWASAARGFPEEEIDLSDVTEKQEQQSGGAGGGGGFFSFLLDLVVNMGHGSGALKNSPSEVQTEVHAGRGNEGEEDQLWHIDETDDDNEVMAIDEQSESSTSGLASSSQKVKVRSEITEEFHLDFHKEEQDMIRPNTEDDPSAGRQDGQEHQTISHRARHGKQNEKRNGNEKIHREGRNHESSTRRDTTKGGLFEQGCRVARGASERSDMSW